MGTGADGREPRLPNLKVDGISRAPGGHYRIVNVNGVVTVAGDVRAESIKVDGHTKLLGSVDAETFACDGVTRVEGELRSGNARTNGVLTVDGAASGGELRQSGMLNVKGDCSYERFVSDGGFAIDGLLNADVIEAKLFAPCRARDIGGEKIAVTAKPKNMLSRLWQRTFRKLSVELTADTIEGDDIALEETTAGVVRGNRVVIGRGCRIGKVEYRSELVVHPGAAVAKEEKIDGGHRFA